MCDGNKCEKHVREWQQRELPTNVHKEHSMAAFGASREWKFNFLREKYSLRQVCLLLSLKRVLERDASTYERLRVTWMRTTHGRVALLNFEWNFFTKFEKFCDWNCFETFLHVSSPLSPSSERHSRVDWICKQDDAAADGLDKLFDGVWQMFLKRLKNKRRVFFWGLTWKFRFFFSQLFLGLFDNFLWL